MRYFGVFYRSGILTRTEHFGHRPVFPAYSLPTWILCPHEQVKWISSPVRPACPKAGACRTGLLLAVLDSNKDAAGFDCLPFDLFNLRRQYSNSSLGIPETLFCLGENNSKIDLSYRSITIHFFFNIKIARPSPPKKPPI